MKQLKTFLFAVLLSIMFLSCREPKLQLPIEEFYLLDIVNFPPMENDTNWHLVERLIKFDKDLDGTIIYKKSYEGAYYIGELQINDKLKNELIDAANNQKQDTLFKEWTGGIYDGPLYVFLLKKDSSTYINCAGIPRNLPQNLLNIQRSISIQDIEALTKIVRNEEVCLNQDSIRGYLDSFRPYIFKTIAPPPPPPIQPNIKFIAPVISTD